MATPTQAKTGDRLSLRSVGAVAQVVGVNGSFVAVELYRTTTMSPLTKIVIPGGPVWLPIAFLSTA